MDSYALGVDVSRWQGVIDWDKAKAAGVTFAFLKATDGATWTDPTFERNYRECKRVSIRVGAYHFVRTDEQPQAQYDNFLAQLVGRELEEGWALDCEEAEHGRKFYAANVHPHTVGISQRLTAHFGGYGTIYSRANFINANFKPWDAWPLHKLWVAAWTTADQPGLPRYWDAWHYWQYQVSKQPALYGAPQASGMDLNRVRVAPQPPEPEPDSLPVEITLAGVRYTGTVRRG